MDVVVPPGSGDYVDILASLVPVFHIQLFKSAEETAETFLADVAAWLTR